MLLGIRFANLLSSGQGSEETKILSASLLVIPMLKDSTDIFTDPSVKMLIESLLQDPSNYGPKLARELLKIIDLILDKMDPEEITEYRKELLKYIWEFLKSSEDTLKYQAYLVVSRFISVFETPPKVIIQVGKGLCRSAGQTILCETSRITIRSAIDVLLPVLSKRLDSKEDQESVVSYAVKLMQEEEGNEIQQRITLWESVARHPTVYVHHKSTIIPHMIRFVMLLGSQPNVELMKLSVALSKVVIDWDINGVTQNQVDTILDILLGYAFVVVTAGRPNQLHQRIKAQILTLLDKIMSSRSSNINSSHFEEALLHHKINAQESHHNDSEEAKHRKSSRSGEHRFNEDGTLLMCAEIVQILLHRDPNNGFLRSNECLSVVNQCMACIASTALQHPKKKLSKVLKDILLRLLILGQTSNSDIGVTSAVIVMLEEALRHYGYGAHFAISVIDKVRDTNPFFIESFIGSLVVAAEEMMNKHIQEESTSPAVTVSSVDSAHYHLLSATPTVGAFEETCRVGFTKPPLKLGDDIQANNGGFKNQIVIRNDTLCPRDEALITSLEIVSSSRGLLAFSSIRTQYFNMLSTILDKCTSLPLLLLAVSFIGKKWLLSDEHTLTRSEREGFLLKLLRLEFERLPEISSQALSDMICCIALTACNDDSSLCMKRISKEETMQKLLVSCLLSANSSIRTLSADALLGNNGPSVILSQVLELNFEAVGKRLFTTVLVDSLLRAGKESANTGVHYHCHLSLNHNSNTSLPQEHMIEVSTHMKDNEYASFMETLLSERASSSSISAIRNLVHGDVETSQSMLILCFQSVWQSLPSSSKASLIVSIERLLAQPFISQQCGRMNVVQSIVRLLVKIRPIPMIDAFLLQSLAADYNVCHEVLYILETQYISLKDNGYEIEPELIHAIHRCYSLVGDRETCVAVSSAMSNFPGTKFALSLAMYDDVNESGNAFLSLINQVDNGNGAKLIATEHEMALWESHWIESQRQLSQWSVIDEYASATQDTALMLECASKMNDWDKVKSLFTLPSVVASLDDPLMKMTELSLGKEVGLRPYGSTRGLGFQVQIREHIHCVLLLFYHDCLHFIDES